MQREDLNRFLQTVRKTRLLDYLDLEADETAEQALERRLRWAARSRNAPEHAAEAAFLLQHGDALRSHLKTSASEEVEDDWIEFGQDEDDGYGRVSLYKSSGANESIDLDELLGGPAAPKAVPPVPEDDDEPDDFFEERAPTAPAAGARSIRPAVTSRGRTPTPAPTERLGGPRSRGRQRTPSALLERARRNSPVPHLGRIGGSRSRTPGTPSPPLLDRRATEGTPRSAGGVDPRRSSSGGVPRVATPPGVPARPASYGAPGHLGGSATPAPLRSPSPAPAGARAPTPGGFDVRITGHTNFLRNNDHYGTSEVVYESEMHSGHPLRTPMPARTPSTGQRMDGPEGRDILGSLRGNMRRGGTTSPAKGSIATKPQSIPIWVYLIPITALVAIICTYLVLLSWGMVNNPLLDNSPVTKQGQGDAFDQPATIAPVDPGPGTATPAVVDTDAATDGTGDAGPVTTDSAEGSTTNDSTSGSSGSTGSSSSGGSTTTADASGSGGSKASDGRGASSGTGGSKTSTGSKSGSGDSKSGSGDSKSGSGDSKSGSGDSKSSTDAAGGSDASTGGSGTDTTGGSVGDGAVEQPPVVAPAPPKGLMAGAWKGAVGDQSCLADLSQRDESVNGTITVQSEQYQVSGRYNPAKGSIYLTGNADSDIVFRGVVDDGRVTGKAKLGAGKLYQVWQLRR